LVRGPPPLIGRPARIMRGGGGAGSVPVRLFS
jgi:hypothetical protein